MENTDKNNFNATIGNTVLCDGFLIPMTDFVNNVGNMENYPSHEKVLSWIYNYATFLKQPLKLEMFISDEKDCNGNKVPDFLNFDTDKNNVLLLSEYVMLHHPSGQIVKLTYVGFSIRFCVSRGIIFQSFEDMIEFKIRTIEDLVKHSRSHRFKLSQNALNAIFGKTVA